MLTQLPVIPQYFVERFGQAENEKALAGKLGRLKTRQGGNHLRPQGLFPPGGIDDDSPKLTCHNRSGGRKTLLDQKTLAALESEGLAGIRMNEEIAPLIGQIDPISRGQLPAQGIEQGLQIHVDHRQSFVPSLPAGHRHGHDHRGALETRVGAGLPIDEHLRQIHLLRRQAQSLGHVELVALFLQIGSADPGNARSVPIHPDAFQPMRAGIDEPDLEIFGMGLKQGTGRLGQHGRIGLRRPGQAGEQAGILGRAPQRRQKALAQHLGGGHQAFLGTIQQQAPAGGIGVIAGEPGSQHRQQCQDQGQPGRHADLHGNRSGRSPEITRSQSLPRRSLSSTGSSQTMRPPSVPGHSPCKVLARP